MDVDADVGDVVVGVDPVLASVAVVEDHNNLAERVDLALLPSISIHTRP